MVVERVCLCLLFMTGPQMPRHLTRLPGRSLHAGPVPDCLVCCLSRGSMHVSASVWPLCACLACQHLCGPFVPALLASTMPLHVSTCVHPGYASEGLTSFCTSGLPGATAAATGQCSAATTINQPDTARPATAHVYSLLTSHYYFCYASPELAMFLCIVSASSVHPCCINDGLTPRKTCVHACSNLCNAPLLYQENDGYVCAIARIPLLEFTRGGTLIRFATPLAPHTTIR